VIYPPPQFADNQLIMAFSPVGAPLERWRRVLNCSTLTGLPTLSGRGRGRVSANLSGSLDLTGLKSKPSPQMGDRKGAPLQNLVIRNFYIS